jgi:hypothetical protein
VPGIADGGDPNAVELGVKFTTDVPGLVTSIRFFKGAGNTGTHVGNLWTADGTLLATATFTNETATGWQQVDFAVPVAITPGTVYVASYYAPVGHYAVANGYLATLGVDSAPLHAPATTVDANGLFRYGPASSFPTDSFNGNQYWVDVVFQPAGS